ncbi:MAG: phosphohistidine phosphatase SixA [Nitrospirota bacterium]
MLLYLVQHGKPKTKEEDPGRPLSEQGEEDVRAMAEFLSHGVTIRRIFHSGKLRAKQTAEVLAARLGGEAGEADGLNPMDDPGIWEDRLAEETEDMMLVGHLPHLGRLASVLLTGDAGAEIVEFQQGGVACLEKGNGRWQLRWMVVPEVVVK